MENNEVVFEEDIEMIVNNTERQAIIDERYEKRQRHRQEKMLKKAFLFATIFVALIVLTCLDWINHIISMPGVVMSGIWAAFCFGRWFENGKCWGWH